MALSSALYNPDCLSVKAGHSIRSRDTNAALNIALAGASQVLTSSRLPPFRRNFQPTMYTSPSTLASSSSSVRPPMPREPSSVEGFIASKCLLICGYFGPERCTSPNLPQVPLLSKRTLLGYATHAISFSSALAHP